jgi:hypothetical protein
MFWFRIGPSKDDIVSIRGMRSMTPSKKRVVEKASFNYFTCRETPVSRLNVYAYV